MSRVGDTSNALGYGTAPSISLVSPNEIKIEHRARFYPLFTDCLFASSTAIQRQYIYVMENSVESNYPSSFICCPANCCCPVQDSIHKVYYDRGPWDVQDCAHSCGCLKGSAYAKAGPRKMVCCCQDCCQCYNEYSEGMCSCCCGEVISIVPFETYYCCCPNKANFCMNCCGLCGVKSGEPCIMYGYYRHLAIGDAEKLSKAMADARAAWSARTGIK